MRLYFIAVFILLLDQISKQWVLTGNSPFKPSFNAGIAFSLPITGSLAIGIVVVLIFFLLFCCFRWFQKGFLRDLIFGMILGGALANLIDRILFGQVVDFIRLGSFPAFNVADSVITGGFLLLIVFFDKMRK